jgi:ABC-2 type transport system ATP-binding protein
MLSSARSRGHSLPSSATIYIPSVTNAAIRTEHLRKVYTTTPPKSGRGAPGTTSDASRAAAERRGGSEVVALDSLDLEVESGEFFGLLGPNGAGKTTTIGICTTRVLPTSGAAIIEGADVRTQSTLVRQRIGVVPQRPNPDSSLNVRENLVFHAAYFGIARSIANSRARALLEKLGIAEKSEAKVMQLSGGQQQRLMIARALIHEPRVLFLDEPTVGLDPQARLDLWTILRELHSQGRTIVMTTHYMEEADKLCDRLAIVDQGKLLAIDSPEALKARAPGGTMIELVLDGSGEALMRDIRAVPGVSSAEAKSEHGSNSVRVYSDRGGEVIAALVTIATAHARAIRDIHLAPPSLETLFISLTGRQLT